MTKLRADLDLCQGYANCVEVADDYFDVDDDGLVVLLAEDVDSSDSPRVEEATRSCPVNALRTIST